MGSYYSVSIDVQYITQGVDWAWVWGLGVFFHSGENFSMREGKPQRKQRKLQATGIKLCFKKEIPKPVTQ